MQVNIQFLHGSYVICIVPCCSLPQVKTSPGPNHLLHRATPFSNFVKLSDGLGSSKTWVENSENVKKMVFF